MTTRIDALREALVTAEDVLTNAVNDYVPCRCPNIVSGDPASHVECSPSDMMVAMFAARHALALLADDQAAAREAPRRPAREVACGAMGACLSPEVGGHSAPCDHATAMIEADRAAKP